MKRKVKVPVAGDGNKAKISRPPVILTQITARGVNLPGESVTRKSNTVPDQFIPISELAARSLRGQDPGASYEPMWLGEQEHADWHRMDELERYDFMREQARNIKAAKEEQQQKLTKLRDENAKKKFEEMLEQGIQARMKNQKPGNEPVKGEGEA